jgi:hypothetical protein
MLRPLLIACLCAAALATPAAAQPTRTLLMPGVTYDENVEFTLHGPVAVHVIEGPKPSGLYSLEPVLARSSVQGRDRLTAIERRLSPSATVAGVNGDLFSSGGRPNGLFLQDRVMQTPPLGSRSSLGIDAAGNLSVDRVAFFGDWRGTGPRRILNGLNSPANPGGISLLTPGWRGPTPTNRDSVEVVLSPFPAATPNTDLTGTVVQIFQGGNHPIPPGGAILVARGNAATRLAAEAPLGGTVTVRAILPSPLSTAIGGIGGGPVLVRNGRPVFRANESFATSWLVPRTARTAVGQRADGRILLVAVDGSQAGYSSGMTNFELAQELVRLGAVTGMGLDSGQSTTMAFEGSLLNRPSNGERSIADALVLSYYGVQAAPLSEEVLSPNGDGAGEKENLSYKLVRASTVTATLAGPDGTRLTLYSGARAPGLYKFTFKGTDVDGKLLPEGRWTWGVAAVDDLGRSSAAERSFSLNVTLKALTVAPGVLHPGSPLQIGVDLARPARLTVKVESPSGVVLRTLANRAATTGHSAVKWDGRLAGGKRAYPGTYVVRASATNQIGAADLTGSVRVARK